MEAEDVIELLARLRAHSLRAWVAGGWAVDALLGVQTRPHRDLDLAVDAAQMERLRKALHGMGFSTTADWQPSRVELTHLDGRRVDLHPVTFAADGSGSQAGLDDDTSFDYRSDGFTTGIIDGQAVACLSGPQQLSFRQGYEWRDVDRHDVALIRIAIEGLE